MRAKEQRAEKAATPFSSLSGLLGGAPLTVVRRAGPASLARIANMALAEGRSALVVCADRASLTQAQALASLFCPDCSHADPDPASPVWEQRVLSLPQGLLVRDDLLDWPQRLAALYGLSRPGPHILAASVESLLLRLPPTDFFAGAVLDLEAGTERPQEALLERLSDWGYVRSPMVARAGEVARRGDIVDVFAPGYRHPLRLEFFDETLEEIRLFDVDTQRSIRSLPRISILPARPCLLGARDMAAHEARLADLLERGEIGEDVAYDCRKALEAGGRTLLPGSVLPSTSLAEDWLGPDYLVLMEGEQDARDAFVQCAAELEARLAGEGAPVLQSPRLCLRTPGSVPWEGPGAPRGKGPGVQAVSAPALVVGVEERGVALQERPIRAFRDMFPQPGAADRPWQHACALLKRRAREGLTTILSFASGRTRARFLRLAEQDGVSASLRYDPAGRGTFALVSPFRLGAEFGCDGLCVLGENVLAPKAERTPRVSSRVFKGLDAFEDLRGGELLVHREYGIGRFRGLRSVETDGVEHDFLLLEYQGEDRLYVPVDRIGDVMRFRGAEGSAAPSLDRLGGASWGTSRERVRKAVEKIAADLIEMYAYRKVAKGFRYDPPDELYREFEASFPYEETPDQAKAIEDVLADMDRSEPMDRLVCGDVGFGKTEVAMRAAFRAASNGRQVAFLCPTTVLAEQHYQTFRARMGGFPVRVALLSRFVPEARRKATLRAASRGEVDILIGTHRLLSEDVVLPNLGLLVLDEEQRFGVRHKETLKETKRNVDVLTLTATPIPRTLQLSMSGIRDLSLIETPPRERKPVATALVERNEATLQEVVRREIAREGQVFWVHNRVQGLARVADYVRRLVPEARVAMAHGRMSEEEVDGNMRKFWHGEIDVLVCTSIIESGLDFPRANTLVVDQAQNFGLGQLYQLRGRVGRSDRQAFAYFVVPDASHLTEVAGERLRILQDMDFLGAGFKVAMEDLRLRGAGNILGEAQTGQMARVGLDLYLEMLEQAVERIRGTAREKELVAEVNIGVSARIPETYIADGHERLRAYRALSGAASGQERERVALGLRDRFGPFPEEFQTFLAVLDFKQFLGRLQVEKADLGAASLRLTWAEGQNVVDPIKILRRMQEMPGARLVPPATLLLPAPEAPTYREVLEKVREWVESVRTDPGEERSDVVLVSSGRRPPRGVRQVQPAVRRDLNAPRAVTIASPGSAGTPRPKGGRRG